MKLLSSVGVKIKMPPGYGQEATQMFAQQNNILLRFAFKSESIKINLNNEQL